MQFRHQHRLARGTWSDRTPVRPMEHLSFSSKLVVDPLTPERSPRLIRKVSQIRLFSSFPGRILFEASPDAPQSFRLFLGT
jgi:hypothetical protein